MCQTNVVMEKDGEEKLLYENVTGIEVQQDGLLVTTLFEGIQEFKNGAIRRIDFSRGKVYVVQGG